LAGEESSSALVPKGARALGQWGEVRLAQVLGGAGEKPSEAFITKYGARFIDRLVNGIAHEAKAGQDVGLTSSIRTQALKDSSLIEKGQISGANWHFFNGVKQETVDYLGQLGISTTVH
jgi:hypothetical protein